MIKAIKSESDYAAALAVIERLLDRDPGPGTREGDELELLTILVQDYESKRFGERVPDPIEAIKFRMEQQNLSQRDLVPFIGSRSKVSEVLSGKRPLTLSMIRALHAGLRIPAKVLLQERSPTDLEESPVEWDRFPLAEMVARGWIKEKVTDMRPQAEGVLRRFFESLGPAETTVALYRQSHHMRSGRPVDDYALTAWMAGVALRALQDPPPAEYAPGIVNLDFMRELVRLSVFQTGPSLAQEYLRKRGISLIIEPHLARTHLDGAAIMLQAGRPVLGLTLRYDRIDNFWFALMHELAHVSLHLGNGGDQFFDDLDAASDGDPREREADQFAQEALIPKKEWQKSSASRVRSPDAAQQLADRLRIHPAIVAGRMRFHFKSYRILNQVVGHRQVRCLFSQIKWRAR
jgi:HTH-type transcriptional regulator/antitoxin HigA